MKNISAFPQVNLQDSYGMLVPDRQEGMTLRDYFAAKAMQAFIEKYSHESDVSRNAYKFADAMLKARGE
jgi:hypothetical protein